MSRFIALICAAVMTVGVSSSALAADPATTTAPSEVPTATVNPVLVTENVPATEVATATVNPVTVTSNTAPEVPTTSANPVTVTENTASEAPAVNPFKDCQNEWFTDVVSYVYSKGLIAGYDDTTFGPQDNVTKDQLAVILYRLKNADKTLVTEGDNWAEQAEAWTISEGIMAKFTEADKFDGSAKLTREQIVSTMYELYAKTYTSDDTNYEGMAIDEFTDHAKITDYAKTAMRWAIAREVIEGNDANELNPQDNVTRAETSAILERYLEKAAPAGASTIKHPLQSAPVSSGTPATAAPTATETATAAPTATETATTAPTATETATATPTATETATAAPTATATVAPTATATVAPTATPAA